MNYFAYSPRRPHFLHIGLVVLFIGTMLLTTALRAQPATPAERPNIILILTDDMENHPSLLESMPNLQRLMVQGGMTFESALVPISLCCPSRVSIFTGQYAHNHDIVKNAPPDGGFAKAWQQNREATMVTPRLQTAGYHTALMGKYMNGYPLQANPTYIPLGWDEWYVSKGGVNYFDYALIENGHEVKYGNSEADYLTDVLTRKAVDFIERNSQDPTAAPFFLELSIYAPHGPAIPAPRHAGLFPEHKAPRSPSFNEIDVSDKPRSLQFPLLTEAEIAEIDTFYRERLRSLQAVDDLIAELFATLTANGELANTYLFFTSDNGYHQGEHRIAKGKQSPYEESINVPMLVVGPGVAPGSVRMEPISTIDLAPTFAALAGVDAAFTATMDGRSLLPLLQTTQPVDTWRTAVLFEKIADAKVPVNAAGLSAADLAAPDDENSEVQIYLPSASGVSEATNLPRFTGLRTERYSYIQYGNGTIELYDLWADPYQVANIAADPPPELLTIFQQQLALMQNCAGATCRSAETFTLPTEPGVTATPSATGEATATRLPTGTPLPTATDTPTETPTPTPLFTPTLLPTATNTATATVVGIGTPTLLPTAATTTAATATIVGLGTPELTPTKPSTASNQIYLPLVLER